MTWGAFFLGGGMRGAGVGGGDALGRLRGGRAPPPPRARRAPRGVVGRVAELLAAARVQESTVDLGPLAGSTVLERGGRAVRVGLHRDVGFAVAVLVGEGDRAAALRLDDGGVVVAVVVGVDRRGARVDLAVRHVRVDVTAGAVVAAAGVGVVVAAPGGLDPLAARLVVDGLLDDVPGVVQHGVLVGFTIVVRVDERLGGAVVVFDDRGVVDAVLVHVVVDLGLVLLAVDVDGHRLGAAGIGVAAAALVDPHGNCPL